MASRSSFNVLMITIVIGGLLTQSLISSEVTAKDSDSAFAWDVPVSVKAPAKPKPERQRERPAAEHPRKINKGVELAPLLTLKYQVLEHQGDKEVSIDPDKELLTGDQIKLSIMANQDGYLYVIHRTVNTSGEIIDKPRMAFPDPRVKGGKNFVTNDKLPHKVPYDCQGLDDPEDCWWELTPPAGREIFNLIFSRDPIPSLPKPGSEVDLKLLDKIKDSSVAKEKLQKGTKARDVSGKILADGVFVQNPNREDNEEIFWTFEINHKAADAGEQLTSRALVIKNRADGIRVTILKDGTPIDSDQVFNEDDELKVKLKSNFKGYVYFVNVEPGGKRCIIYPCSRKIDNSINSNFVTLLPPDQQVIGFDDKAGTEVFQVIVSPERVEFLDAALKDKNCCDDKNPCSCELSGSAASAAAELASISKQQKSPFAVENLIAVLPKNDPSGVRSRGIKLASGKDQRKGEAFVAIDDKDGGQLQPRQAMVFEMRLKHK